MSGLVVFGMFAFSCVCTSAGICDGSKAMLWGPPDTFVNLIPSPALIVMDDGYRRDRERITADREARIEKIRRGPASEE